MNKKCNQKHLTLSDRTYIEQELLRGSTFKSIADVLHNGFMKSIVSFHDTFKELLD